MIRSYFLLAWRNFLRYRGYSLTNLGGLVLGMTCTLLLFLFMLDEWQYDRFHEGADRIYRIDWHGDGSSPQTRTPHPMAQALLQDFPEVEAAVSITPIWGAGLTRRTVSIGNPETDTWFDEKEILAVDTTFFKVFSFKLIEGDPEKALMRPETVLITASTAARYFGENWHKQGVVGRMLAVESPENVVEIGGVMQDPPAQSHFHFHFLTSYLREKADNPTNPFYSWQDFGHYNYIKLKPGANAQSLQAKLLEWSVGYLEYPSQILETFRRNQLPGFQLMPLTDIHLRSHIRWELESNGNIVYLYIMVGAALMILVIACFNFMNLTNAQMAERVKEIGVRKTLGAQYAQLRLQFLTESILLSFLAMLLSLLITHLSLPFFNDFTEKHITIQSFPFPYLLAWIIGLPVLVGLAGSAYPAWILSRLAIHEVLKGGAKGQQRTHFRHMLLTAQFVAAITLIACSLAIFRQIRFLMHKPLGFEQEALVVIPLNNDFFPLEFYTLQNEWGKLAGVRSVSGASNIVGQQFNQNAMFLAEAPLRSIDVSELKADSEWLSTLGLELVEGRNFLPHSAADSATGFLLNETAVRSLGLSQAVGKEVVLDRESGPVEGVVLGVIKDFHFRPLQEPIRPLVVQYRVGELNHALIKVNIAEFDQNLDAIKQVWQRYAGKRQFQYQWLDQELERNYRAEQKMGWVFLGFTGLSLVVTMLGLVSMLAFSLVKRRKEFSIRKVLGANLLDITWLLSARYMRLVGTAFLVGLPLSNYLVTEWMQQFAYQAPVGWWVYGSAGLVLLLLTFASVASQAWRAASVNPSRWLKTE